jgi:hypothetical protein
MVGVIGMAYSPFVDFNGFQLNQNPSSNDGNKNFLYAPTPSNQAYIVLQVNTVTQKSFNVFGFNYETIYDVKNRI